MNGEERKRREAVNEKETLERICSECALHGQLQQQVNFNWRNSELAREEAKLRVDKLEDKVEVNEDNITRRPTVAHILALTGALVTVLVSIVGMQLISNRRVNDHLLVIVKELAETKATIKEHQKSSEQFNHILEEIKRLREE